MSCIIKYDDYYTFKHEIDQINDHSLIVYMNI